MANIKTHLNNIKGALYGKDVRSSIHDGIDAINNEVESTTGRQVDLENTFDQLIINAGNSNAEIVDARVKSDGTSYSKLGDRLNEVDSQLEQIAVNVRTFGAKGDGINDDTKAFQDAFTYIKECGGGSVLVPNGTYLISVHDEDFNEDTYLMDNSKIKIYSNTHLKMDNSAILKVKPNSKKQYNALAIVNSENINIEGGKIIGDRYEHINSDGEYGYGIALFGAKNITIKNMNISNCWGDGINLQLYDGGKVCENIFIDNVVCDNNRRQGMSIESGHNVYVSNSSFINTNGVAPQCGVDIEPWVTSLEPICKQIYFTNCRFENNKSYGVYAYGQGCVKDVFIDNCSFDNNSSGNGHIGLNKQVDGVKITNCKSYDGFLASFLDSKNIEVKNNTSNGPIAVRNCENVVINNNNFNISKIQNENFIVENNVKNIVFTNNIIKGLLTNDLCYLLLDFKDIEGLTFKYNTVSNSKKIHIDVNNANIECNTFENITVTFKLAGECLNVINNTFRAFGNAYNVIWCPSKLKKSIFKNNIVSNIITSDEKTNGIVENENRVDFVNLSGEDNLYEDITIFNNCLPYNVSITNKMNLVNIYSVDNNIKKLVYKSNPTSNMVDVFLSSVSNTVYRVYEVELKITGSWNDKDRRGTTVIKFNVEGGKELTMSNMKSVEYTSNKVVEGYLLSDLYKKNGMYCVTISTYELNESQTFNLNVKIEDKVNTSIIDADNILITKGELNTNKPADVSFKRVLPVNYSTTFFPRNEDWFIPNGANLLNVTNKKNAMYYLGGWFSDGVQVDI